MKPEHPYQIGDYVLITFLRYKRLKPPWHKTGPIKRYKYEGYVVSVSTYHIKVFFSRKRFFGWWTQTTEKWIPAVLHDVCVVEKIT